MLQCTACPQGFGITRTDPTVCPKDERNQSILKAYREYKFPLKEIAAHLKMNPNYLCDILKRLET